MGKYVLRAVRQVVVVERLPEERVVECDTDAQLEVEIMNFLNEKFPAKPGVEPEVNSVDTAGVETRQPLPGARKDTKYGMPF